MTGMLYNQLTSNRQGVRKKSIRHRSRPRSSSSRNTSKNSGGPDDENSMIVEDVGNPVLTDIPGKHQSSKSARNENHSVNDFDMISNEVAVHTSPGSCVEDSILLRFQHIRGKVLNSMLHKTYLKLKDKQLLYGQQNDRRTTKRYSSLNSSTTIEGNEIPVISCGTTTSLGTVDKTESHLCTKSDDVTSYSFDMCVKQRFYHNLYMKYQNPSPQEVKKLSAQFPEPEKLFHQVMKPLCEADPRCKPRLVISDHLQNHYWTAQLTFPWFCNLIVKSRHPQKGLAVRGAYWLACDRLKSLAFISRNEDGTWVPMTCDKVVAMLETLSRYGDSSFGNSRGRGFKIILEQIKYREACVEVNNMKKDCELRKDARCHCKDKHLSCIPESCLYTSSEGKENEVVLRGNADSVEVNEENSCRANEVNLENFCHSTESASSNIPRVLPSDISGTSTRALCIATPDCYKTRKTDSPAWLCTVHVGWPFPFSIEAEGVSLPSAQMMGYVTVANKLKMKGLLTVCNNAVSCLVLENYIACHTLKHWEKNMTMLWDAKASEKFDANAEIFCDASRQGFGAYLVLKGSGKVRWISEKWKDQEVMEDQLFTENRDKQYLQSNLAELFAIVTAVFSWKQKLRSRKLLCFCDNMVVAGIINSFTSDHIEADRCTSAIDHMIHTLQKTGLQYNIIIQATWHDRHKNWLADCLSRNNIKAFQAAVPEAACTKTAAKKLRIKKGSTS